MKALEVKELYTLSETLAAPLLESVTYPWEALPKIHDFILKLGESLSEEEYEKRRADYFYGLDLFGKAVTIYEQILDGAGRHLSGDFRGKVWNNIAACYAKLFCYQKAMHAYENAWNAKPEAEYVKRMYFLTILNPELSLKDKFREMIGEDDKEVWNKDVEEAREESEKAPETLKLAAVFEEDPAGRIAAAGDILNQWKMEYRRML